MQKKQDYHQVLKPLWRTKVYGNRISLSISQMVSTRITETTIILRISFSPSSTRNCWPTWRGVVKTYKWYERFISRSFQNTCVNRLQLGMMLWRVIIYDGMVSRMRGVWCVRVVWGWWENGYITITFKLKTRLLRWMKRKCQMAWSLGMRQS